MAISTAVMVGESQEWIPELVERAKKLQVNAGEQHPKTWVSIQVASLRLSSLPFKEKKEKKKKKKKFIECINFIRQFNSDFWLYIISSTTKYMYMKTWLLWNCCHWGILSTVYPMVTVIP